VVPVSFKKEEHDKQIHPPSQSNGLCFTEHHLQTVDLEVHQDTVEVDVEIDAPRVGRRDGLALKVPAGFPQHSLPAARAFYWIELRAPEKAPDFAEAYHNLAHCLLRQGDPTGAGARIPCWRPPCWQYPILGGDGRCPCRTLPGIRLRPDGR